MVMWPKRREFCAAQTDLAPVTNDKKLWVLTFQIIFQLLENGISWENVEICDYSFTELIPDLTM